MAQWLRFERNGQVGFGTLSDGTIAVHTGDMFAGAKPSGETVKLSDVKVLTPCTPSKLLALWNNFVSVAKKNEFIVPDDPLYFVKTPNSYNAHGQPIVRPKGYSGKILYEGELGVVIGKKCSMITEAEAKDYIFGYTCVNDVTGLDVLRKNPS